jgi:hypothetical protein
VHYTNASGVDLVYGLNGVLRNKNSSGYPTTWDSRNAAAFIAYNKQRGHAIWAYELGNEPGDHPTGPAGWANVSLAAHAQDFGDLQDLLASEFGHGPARPLVLGPDACIGSYLKGLLAHNPAINITTVHKYFCMDVSGSFQNCSVDDLMSPRLAPAIARSAKSWVDVASVVPQPVWLGEGAIFWNHHSPLNFAMFAIVPSYLQQLGELAKSGLKLFNKQSLIDLILPTTLEVTPNYWAAFLWKKLMGTSVFAASATGTPLIRVYVHNGVGDEAASTWALCLINIGANASVIDGLPVSCASRAIYALTAPAANVTSPTVLLNGAALRLSSDGTLPELLPHVEVCAPRLELPPFSAVFVVMGRGQIQGA